MDGFSMQQCMLMCHACFMFVSSPGPSHEDTVLAKLSDLIIILLLRANNQAWSGIDMLVGSTYVQCKHNMLVRCMVADLEDKAIHHVHGLVVVVRAMHLTLSLIAATYMACCAPWRDRKGRTFTSCPCD